MRGCCVARGEPRLWHCTRLFRCGAGSRPGVSIAFTGVVAGRQQQLPRQRARPSWRTVRASAVDIALAMRGRLYRGAARVVARASRFAAAGRASSRRTSLPIARGVASSRAASSRASPSVAWLSPRLR
jgi:hypothetical protein